jgi:hypothetical protein
LYLRSMTSIPEGVKAEARTIRLCEEG